MKSVKVLLRLFPSDLGWDQISRWKDDMPEVMIDTGKKYSKINKKFKNLYFNIQCNYLLRVTQLEYSNNYFLESKPLGVKKEVEPYFELLKSVGVFHETP